MKKFFLFALVAMLLVGFSSTSFAQIKVGATAGLALPMGDFGDGWKMGFGGGVEGKYFLSDNLALGASLGYYAFSAKDVDIDLKSEDASDPSFSVMPILATVDYFFANEGFKPFVGAGVGLFSMKSKVYVPFFGDVEATSSELGVAPTVGFLYGISDKLDFNLNAKYNMIFTEGSSTTYLGVNAGVLFSF